MCFRNKVIDKTTSLNQFFRKIHVKKKKYILREFKRKTMQMEEQGLLITSFVLFLQTQKVRTGIPGNQLRRQRLNCRISGPQPFETLHDFSFIKSEMPGVPETVYNKKQNKNQTNTNVRKDLHFYYELSLRMFLSFGRHSRLQTLRTISEFLLVHL